MTSPTAYVSLEYDTYQGYTATPRATANGDEPRPDTDPTSGRPVHVRAYNAQHAARVIRDDYHKRQIPILFRWHGALGDGRWMII